MKFCSQCGAELEPGSKFCSSCGSAIAAAPVPAAALPVAGPPATAAPTVSARAGSRGFKYAFLGLVLVLVAGGGYLYATPYLAMQKFRSAIERGAYSELSDSIDYEALKRSLSRAVKDGLAQIAREEEEAGNKGGGDVLGGLSGLMGMGVDRVLDKAVTPEALRQIESAAAAGKPLFDAAKRGSGQPSQQEEFERLVAKLKNEADVSRGYTGLNSFEVRASHPQMGTAKLLFARHGLADWRLAGVDVGDALPKLARQLGLTTPLAARREGSLVKTEKGQNVGASKRAEADYAARLTPYLAQPIEKVALDPEARGIGEEMFRDACAQCHGLDGRGRVGVPNLTDSEWQWGGAPDAIKTTIAEGRRAAMPPMAAAVGGAAEVEDLAHYVLSLSGSAHDYVRAARGKDKFAACAACHGRDGRGNPALGSVDLTNKNWMYGGTVKAITETITKGRSGTMPGFKGRLPEGAIHVLAAYVYSLGNRPSSALAERAAVSPAKCEIVEWLGREAYPDREGRGCWIRGRDDAQGMANLLFVSLTQKGIPEDEVRRRYAACLEVKPDDKIVVETCDIGNDYAITGKVQSSGRILMRAKFCKAARNNPGTKFGPDRCPEGVQPRSF